MDPTDGDEAAYMRFEPEITLERGGMLALREECEMVGDVANIKVIDLWLEADREAQYNQRVLTLESAAMHKRIPREHMEAMAACPESGDGPPF